MEKLAGDYIAGFVDGEGCFALKFRRDIKHKRRGSPVYFYWDIEFAIVLRKDDKEILEKIRETLGCGRITIDKYGMARYAINNMSELSDIIIPFFNKYPLRAKKKLDFELWKEAVMLLRKNRGLKTNIASTGNPRGKRNMIWNPKELSRLKAIHESMKSYKSWRRSEWKWINKINTI